MPITQNKNCVNSNEANVSKNEHQTNFFLVYSDSYIDIHKHQVKQKQQQKQRQQHMQYTPITNTHTVLQPLIRTHA